MKGQVAVVDGDVGARQLQFHRHQRRGGIHHRIRKQGRGGCGRSRLDVAGFKLERDVDAAQAGAEDDAGALGPVGPTV